MISPEHRRSGEKEKRERSDEISARVEQEHSEAIKDDNINIKAFINKTKRQTRGEEVDIFNNKALESAENHHENKYARESCYIMHCINGIMFI